MPLGWQKLLLLFSWHFKKPNTFLKLSDHPWLALNLQLWIFHFLFALSFPVMRASWWLRWWRIYLQCRTPGFDPWVGKILWRRAWQPIPVFLPGESPHKEEPGGLQSMGSQRVGHDWATKHSTLKHHTNTPWVIPLLRISLGKTTCISAQGYIHTL